MSSLSLLDEPSRVEEPQVAQEFSAVLSQVAGERRTVIVQRNGADFAAVIPIEDLALVRELIAQQEVERMAAQIDWGRVRQTLKPPQSWFEGEEPKPF